MEYSQDWNYKVCIWIGQASDQLRHSSKVKQNRNLLTEISLVWKNHSYHSFNHHLFELFSKDFLRVNKKKAMPGHIKKTTGPDPDPSPWLVVSAELKNKLKSKPYDPKKSCWVPNKADGGYLEGLIESKDGAKVTVNVKGEV